MAAGQAATSSATTSIGLNPSDFFALNARRLIVVFVLLIYRSDFRGFVIMAIAGVFSTVNVNAL